MSARYVQVVQWQSIYGTPQNGETAAGRYVSGRGSEERRCRQVQA